MRPSMLALDISAVIVCVKVSVAACIVVFTNKLIQIVVFVAVNERAVFAYRKYVAVVIVGIIEIRQIVILYLTDKMSACVRTAAAGKIRVALCMPPLGTPIHL